MNHLHTNELVINIIKLQSEIQKRIGDSLSVHGISVSDYLVLYHLYQAPLQKLRRSDLASKVNLTPSGVTRLLNPLEKIGLVQKESNPRDARVSLVALTATGITVYQESTVSFEAASEKIFFSLDKKQLTSFADLTQALLQKLNP